METPANSRVKREKYESSVWEELLGGKIDVSEGQPGGELQDIPPEQKTEALSVVDLQVSATQAWKQISLSLSRESIWPASQHPSPGEPRQWPAAEKDGTGERQMVASTAIHTEIAALATHIRQWREKIQLSLPEPTPARQPGADENPSEGILSQSGIHENASEEDDGFPAWLI